jgi:hypothetical protein
MLRFRRCTQVQLSSFRWSISSLRSNSSRGTSLESALAGGIEARCGGDDVRAGAHGRVIDQLVEAVLLLAPAVGVVLVVQSVVARGAIGVPTLYGLDVAVGIVGVLAAVAVGLDQRSFWSVANWPQRVSLGQRWKYHGSQTRGSEQGKFAGTGDGEGQEVIPASRPQGPNLATAHGRLACETLRRFPSRGCASGHPAWA